MSPLPHGALFTTMTSLAILIVLGIGVGIMLFIILWPRPPQAPAALALADMRGCERRVGIPAPAYNAVREMRYGAYIGCMVNLGYTSKTLP